MTTPLVYVDFNNLGDTPDQLRLTCAGTIADLQQHGIELSDGLQLTFYSDDADDEGRSDRLLMNGIVKRNADCWVAEMDWDTLRHESDEKRREGGTLAAAVSKSSGGISEATP